MAKIAAERIVRYLVQRFLETDTRGFERLNRYVLEFHTQHLIRILETLY